MKSELLKAYEGRHAELKSVRAKFPNDNISGAILISPNEKYAKQSKPLLIIGQETSGWDYKNDNLVEQMKVSEDFNLGEQYYASPFWNVVRKVERVLGHEEYSCAQTNISKFDVEGGRAYGEHEIAISALDNLLVTEIDILQPKICLFFTGPNFDDRISKIFPNVEFVAVGNHPINQFSQLRHENLPLLTFRSYHPRYLRQSGQENNFIEFITSLK
jgi:hypothetical protein